MGSVVHGLADFELVSAHSWHRGLARQEPARHVERRTPFWRMLPSVMGSIGSLKRGAMPPS